MMNGIDENYIETIYKKIKIPLVGWWNRSILKFLKFSENSISLE